MGPTDWTGSKPRVTHRAVGTQTRTQRGEELVIPSTAQTGFKYATLQHDMLEVKGEAGQRSEVPGREGGRSRHLGAGQLAST